MDAKHVVDFIVILTKKDDQSVSALYVSTFYIHTTHRLWQQDRIRARQWATDGEPTNLYTGSLGGRTEAKSTTCLSLRGAGFVLLT